MTDCLHLPYRDHAGHYTFVVESPRGSVVKWRYDPARAVFVFQRALQLGTSYPFDWGFIPSTRAPDGDPIDAMLLFEAPSWPGVVIPAKPIGLIRLTQKEHGQSERNDRVILLPVGDPRYADVRSLPERTREELQQFFVTISEWTDKQVTIGGWEGPEAAAGSIDQAAREFGLRGPT